MSLLVYYVIISKMKQGNKKLKDNLLCYFKCSFKQDKLDFRVQFSFNGFCCTSRFRLHVLTHT